MLILKLVIEILILWVWFALFMLALVGRKGPVGGIIFYPKVMQDRVIEMGLTTSKKIKQRTVISMTLLLIGDLIFPIVMILFINGARGYFECAWQYYVLFYGMEFFDWFFVDYLWVAKSKWWIIPGTEDLLDTWHDPKYKATKMLKLLIMTVPEQLTAEFQPPVFSALRSSLQSRICHLQRKSQSRLRPRYSLYRSRRRATTGL